MQPSFTDPTAAPATAARTSQLVDRALVRLAAGDRRTILELVRDRADALAVIQASLGMSPQAVSADLAMFHSLEFEDQLERQTARYDESLLDAARLEPTDRVLAIGCGSGPAARVAAARVTAGSVHGIDISTAQVQRARERSRAEHLANVTYETGDAGSYPYAEASFDVAFSRFGAMYFSHPVPAFAHIRGALRPGGRLALVAWRDATHNEWITAVADALAPGRALPPRPPGTPGAFGLAEEGHVRRTLDGAGFVDVALEERSEPVELGPDGASAYAMVSTQTLAGDLLSGLDAAERRQALSRLRDVLDAHQTPDGVLFGSACWLVTARRP